MKKILITGKNSYVGNAVGNILPTQEYQVNYLDVKSDNWKHFDFSGIDVVFHVAGITPFNKSSGSIPLYKEVNTYLAIDVAKNAKRFGVKQFIFMSSMSVYSGAKLVDGSIFIDTAPKPKEIYGETKLQAELELSKLVDDNFKIAILRPPMIYGKNSKGNYPKLSKLAKLLPIFPDFYNQRSMLHIDNLCEFIKQIIDNEQGGLFFPQNAEYVSTSNLVQEIAAVAHKKIILVKFLNPIIKLMFKFDLVKKLFGNLVYEKSMSQYDFEYQIRDFKSSIKLTEEK